MCAVPVKQVRKVTINFIGNGGRIRATERNLITLRAVQLLICYQLLDLDCPRLELVEKADTVLGVDIRKTSSEGRDEWILLSTAIEL